MAQTPATPTGEDRAAAWRRWGFQPQQLDELPHPPGKGTLQQGAVY
ncbi:MAG: hypothetical protein HC804_01450 [Anaerolineae bacterium]|nr:hypothetical protein [Anaerolineae bacterium]